MQTLHKTVCMLTASRSSSASRHAVGDVKPTLSAGRNVFYTSKQITTDPYRGTSFGLPRRQERVPVFNMAFAKDEGDRTSAENQSLLKSPLVRAVLLAQVLSLLLCVMGTTSGLLVARGVNMPASQAVLNYLLLAITCGAYHLKKRGLRLSNPWYVYLFLACLDVEANFLVTKAYQYTSVTSVTLLDCFTIPAVMVLSALLLRARYQPGHFMGALLCIGGLAVLVVTDGSSTTGGSDPLLGDALVLMGAVLYACSNVAQERLLLGAAPVSELLAVVGGFGVLVGGLQATLLERGAWLAADWSDPWAVAVPLAGFALALYAFALSLPLVLIWSGATVLNLSLLTSDVWAAGARVVFFGGFGGTAGWFALSLVCEAVGLVVYTRAGQTHPHPGDLAVGSGGDSSGSAVRTSTAGSDGGSLMRYQRIESFQVEGDALDPESLREGRCNLSDDTGGQVTLPASTATAAVAAGLTAVAAVSGFGRGGVVGGGARGYGVYGTAEEKLRLVSNVAADSSVVKFGEAEGMDGGLEVEGPVRNPSGPKAPGGGES